MELNYEQLDELVLLINKHSNEQHKRIFFAAIALVYGWGGETRIKELTGVALSTLHRGKEEILNEETIEDNRVRRPGGGRKALEDNNPEICRWIEEIVDGATYGDPSKVIHWVSTTLSLRKIAETITIKHKTPISHVKVNQLLAEMGYSKQQNQKQEQIGIKSKDRDKQFQYINDTANKYLDKGWPVISVDTKKKENIGNFKNEGREYRKKEDARRVLDHDFPLDELGKVSPYGGYVLNNNTGFINLGTDHDTAEFAVQSIYRWWKTLGHPTFPKARRIYITCDGGGSNGVRNKLWKAELQKFADSAGLEVMVSHYPPGTSKWNKIEHRMFCYISKSWQGQPLIDIKTVVSLISKTTTKTGLKIKCRVDNKKYKTGIKVSEEEYENINLNRCEILGDWNYIIKPRK